MRQYEAYPFVLNEGKTHYHFQSIGKRGVFEKAITFSPLTSVVYNLALLDFDLETGDFVDDTITDNGDMPEVLATVMAVIIQYLRQYPHRWINIAGNTQSRTRLYQIAIRKVFPDFCDILSIQGYRNDGWFNFEPNVSFESFLIGWKSLDS
jgi:hypothetical protein